MARIAKLGLRNPIIAKWRFGYSQNCQIEAQTLKHTTSASLEEHLLGNVAALTAAFMQLIIQRARSPDLSRRSPCPNAQVLRNRSGPQYKEMLCS